MSEIVAMGAPDRSTKPIADKVLIAGAGIGGLTTALALYAQGIEAELFEQSREIRELGVGFTLLPHAVKVLAGLGLLPALDAAGIRTSELIYATRLGQTVWRELRGLDAGYEVPQFGIHRGRLLGILHRAVCDRLGPAAIHVDCRLCDFAEHGDRVAAQFRRRNGEGFTATGSVLIGADGIHSAVRSRLYPDEGPPIWSGHMLWRGARDWPVFGDGRTQVIAGGNAAKFVIAPIDRGATPESRLTNWAVMARVGEAGGAPVRREDWSRSGRLDEVLPFVTDRFDLGFMDAATLIEATGAFLEYPNCDRDPLPRWSFGRVSLLGDAAHPMYPTGSNGAGQAILDATALTRHLSSGAPAAEALAAYDAERRPLTATIVQSNRKGGPEGVIDLVEARAPDGFDDIDAVASHAERQAIVRGYASLAGFAREQVNRPEPAAPLRPDRKEGPRLAARGKHFQDQGESRRALELG